MPQIIQLIESGTTTYFHYINNSAPTDVNGASRVRLTHLDEDPTIHTVDVIDTNNQVISSFPMSGFEEKIIEKNPTDRIQATTHTGAIIVANSIGYRDNAYPHESFKPIGIERTLSSHTASGNGNDDDTFGGATLVRVFNTHPNDVIGKGIFIKEETSPGIWTKVSETYILPESGNVILKKPEQRILGYESRHLGVAVAF